MANEQRAIKFRAWDRKNREMIHNPVANDICITEYIGLNEVIERFIKEDFTLMQFTGLHDKDGKEIYEGDILKGHTSYERDDDDYSWDAIEVKHDETATGFYPLTLNGRWRCDVIVEVIGNIYENAELLKEREIE
jgi:uncharacterized phage protein (TIGR01671 family)